ncbi:sensor histidine kinase [Xylophilus sp. ASV27]|uniref:sensor histidine kinase n=1 Tax=Xylophilus sp. ASV27 TaxID=2795129 RepID=UPI0018EB1053|nr:ATP-binding protein [Xylophilus sp. ASV27]
MKLGNWVSCLHEVCLLAVAWLVWPATAGWAAPAPSPLLHGTQAEILRDTPARMHSAPVLEAVDEAQLAGRWEPTALPLALPRNALPGLQTTWIRIRLDALEEVRGATRFYLPRWLAAGYLAIYADGRLVYQSPGSPVWSLFTHPAVMFPLSQGVDGTPPRTLLVRIDRSGAQAGALSSFYLGEPAQVATLAERKDFLEVQMPFMMSAAFVLVGVFALGVWVVRRRYPGHLIFAISLLSMLRRWHFELGIERLPVPDVWFVWLTLNALVWQIVCTHQLLRLLHGRRQPVLMSGLVAMGCLLTVVSLPAGFLHLPNLLVARQTAYLMVMAMALVVSVNGCILAWRTRSVDAALLAGAFTITFVGGVADYVRLLYFTDAESVYFTPHAALVFALTCIYILFRRYLRGMDDIESANAGLEERVRAREVELKQSYERLHQVEMRQTLIEERQRLMQDMHDGLGSSLTSALRVVESGQRGNVDLSGLLKSCIDDLKLAIDSLEPVDADLLLLLATLRYRLGPRLKAAGILLHWEVTEVPRLDWLDPRKSLHILRILQEAFANILKHTQATEIRVATGLDGGWVWVTITDNGPGFDPEEGRQRRGRGLANQERRATELGGMIGFEAAQPGTRVRLMIPVDQERSRRGALPR